VAAQARRHLSARSRRSGSRLLAMWRKPPLPRIRISLLLLVHKPAVSPNNAGSLAIFTHRLSAPSKRKGLEVPPWRAEPGADGDGVQDGAGHMRACGREASWHIASGGRASQTVSIARHNLVGDVRRFSDDWLFDSVGGSDDQFRSPSGASCGGLDRFVGFITLPRRPARSFRVHPGISSYTFDLPGAV